MVRLIKTSFLLSFVYFVFVFAVQGAFLDSLRSLLNLGHSSQLVKELENSLAAAASRNDINLLHQLLEKGVNPSVNNNGALRTAAAAGHFDIVERLLSHPRVDSAATNNKAQLRVVHLQKARLGGKNLW